MKRIAGLLLLALGLSLPVGDAPVAADTPAAPSARGVPVAAVAQAATRFADPLDDAGGCKPGAPMGIDLRQTGVHDGSVVDLQFEIAPSVELTGASWRLDLPPGAQLLSGPGAGSLAPGRASTGRLSASVRLPTSGESCRVSLVVDGSFRSGSADDNAVRAAAIGGAGDERVQSRRSLVWGRPSSTVPVRRMIDPEGGAVERLAVLSSRHRQGR